MPRARRIFTDRAAYHINARSNNQEWFRLPLEQVWYAMQAVLEQVEVSYAARIMSFVLMSNHFHMLIDTPLANLDRIMNYLMREISREVGRLSHRTNHLFGGPYRPTLIQDPFHFAIVYKYIYRNPVRAGMAERPEDYPFSTLQSLHTGTPLLFVPHDLDHPLARRVPPEWSERILWLNVPTRKEEEELIRKGLRRSNFALSRQKSYQPTVKRMMEEF